MEENQPNSIEAISPADWAATPENVKRLVANLIGQIEPLASRIEPLERQYEELKAEHDAQRTGEAEQQEFIQAPLARYG